MCIKSSLRLRRFGTIDLWAVSKVNGLNGINSAFSNLEAKLISQIQEVIENNIEDLKIDAIRDAPAGGDNISVQGGQVKLGDIKPTKGWTPISQAIGSKLSPDKLKGSVFVETNAGDVAAWVEFGTGQSAKSYLMTVSKEWREVAQKYYVNGRGTIIAKPYLYNNFLKYQLNTIKELTALLKNVKF